PQRGACETERVPRLEAGTERSSELVLAAIADEQGVGREQIEVATREQLHLRVRLGEAGHARKERDVEERAQRGPVPAGHIFRKAVGDQRESQTPCSQRLDGRQYV